MTDAILEASESTQTFVTTHSVELLDNEELPHRSVFPVELSAGESRIDSLDDACVEAIDRGDFTTSPSASYSPWAKRRLGSLPPNDVYCFPANWQRSRNSVATIVPIVEGDGEVRAIYRWPARPPPSFDKMCRAVAALLEDEAS